MSSHRRFASSSRSLCRNAYGLPSRESSSERQLMRPCWSILRTTTGPKNSHQSERSIPKKINQLRHSVDDEGGIIPNGYFVAIKPMAGTGVSKNVFETDKLRTVWERASEGLNAIVTLGRRRGGVLTRPGMSQQFSPCRGIIGRNNFVVMDFDQKGCVGKCRCRDTEIFNQGNFFNSTSCHSSIEVPWPISTVTV